MWWPADAGVAATFVVSHEQQIVRVALSAAAHHYDKVEEREWDDALWRQTEGFGLPLWQGR